MTQWRPLTLNDLHNQIRIAEENMSGELWDFWQLIKINPVKWTIKEYEADASFWVVAIYETQVIWYNDIEEGFNISGHKTSGEIGEYFCEEDELGWAVMKLLNQVKSK